MSASDQELLERWTSRHDAEAFKDLTARYAGMVFSTCRRIVGNDADAEDVAQECFIALIRAGKTPGAYLGPWLHKVATNRSLNWIRKDSRRANREFAQPEAAAEISSHTDREMLALVDEAITGLPEKQRIPVVAYFFENQSHEAIAQNLGLTRQGAAYRIQKGVESIRKSLKRQGITAASAALSTLLANEATAAAPATLSVELGKLALRGPLIAEQAVAASNPLAILLALKTKGLLSAGLVLLIAIAGAYTLWRPVPPSSPTPVPITDAQSTDATQSSTPQDETALASAANAPSPNQPETIDNTPGATSTNTVPPNHAHADPHTHTDVVEDDSPEGEAATITGYVTDDGAFPIPGAKVSMVLSWTTNTIFDGHGSDASNIIRSTTTDSNGLYVFEGLSAQTVYLSASAKGYKTISKRIQLEEGQTHDNIGFALSRGIMLTGIVLTQVGTPIANAVVAPLGTVERGGSGSGAGYITNIAITDADGTFSIGFRGIGKAALKVSSPHNGEAMFTNIPIGEEDPVELILGSAPTLSGTISNEDGTPASGLQVGVHGEATVEWISPEGNPASASSLGDRRQTITDDNGRYQFPELTANMLYSAQVKTNRSEALSFHEDLGIFESGSQHKWDYTLKSMIRVSGTITGAETGKPIKGLRISYVRDGEFTEGSHLAEDNRYEVRLFESGSYFFFPEYNTWSREITMDTYGIEIDVSAGEVRELNFQLPDSFTMSVRVVDQDGNPIPNVVVDWLRRTPMGNGMYGSGKTDAEGRHSSDFVPDLKSWMYVHKDGYSSTRTTPILGEPAEVYPEETVVLYRTGGIEGIAVDAQGRPLPNGELRIAHRAEGVSVHYSSFINSDTILTTTDENGAFAIGDGFPAVLGDIHIYIRLDDDKWVPMPTIQNIEVPAQYIANIGTVTFIEP